MNIMLFFVSITLIFLVTSFIIFYTYIKRNILTSMTGMIVSMTNSMLTSIAFGTIFGIFINDKDLTLPTTISVSIGMIVGYLTGRPISLIVSLDGITAGIMGGMMGAMLGVMTQPKNAEIMVSFIDIIYFLVNILLVRVLVEETQSTEITKRPLAVNIIGFIVLFIFVGFLISFNFDIFSR